MASFYADGHFVSNFSGQLKLTLGALSSRSAVSVLVGALFKNVCLFLIRGVCFYTFQYFTDNRTVKYWRIINREMNSLRVEDLNQKLLYLVGFRCHPKW
jgi:hypothetical protein